MLTPYPTRVLSCLLFVITLAPALHGCGSSLQTESSQARIPTARSSNAYNAYIDRYATIAIQNQKTFGIPASIILAQGLLESGAGNSKLAREANNHFGIKCHSGWKGKRIYHRDDRPNDCFRSYARVEDSFQDHAEFLKRPRYASLFRLDPKDYKGWAKGLQQCGYATDKGYANKLIKIIEDNRLYLIDRNNPGRHYAYASGSTSVQRPQHPIQQVPMPTSKKQAKRMEKSSPERQYYLSNGLLYVIAQENDDLASIARDAGISERKITQFNEFPEGYPLERGDIVYLQPKHSKAQPPHYEHLVKVGESIHQISQIYGIKIEYLYKLNNLTADYYPKEGDVLRLR